VGIVCNTISFGNLVGVFDLQRTEISEEIQAMTLLKKEEEEKKTLMRMANLIRDKLRAAL
jgi:hypothetical protein